MPGEVARRLGLNEEQTRAVADTDHDILVSAGAGTGKTRVLTARYLTMLLELGYRPGQVAAITFTNKAAAEMRDRIRRGLEELADDFPAAPELAVELNWAPIQTIHSFCGDLLRRLPAAAGIEPDFGVLPEGEASLLLAEACRDALAEALSAADEPPGLGELLACFGLDGLQKLLAETYRRCMVYGQSPGEAWGGGEGAASALDAARRDLLAWWDSLSALDRGGMAPGTAAALAELLSLGEDFRAAVDEAAAGAAADPVLAEVRRLLGGLRAKEAREVAAGGREALKSFATAAAVARAERIRPAWQALLRRAAALFGEVKRRRNVLDFADLELRARDLLRGEENRRAVQEAHPVLLVDEFQDTNPLQWAIIERVWRGPQGGRLFAVGDVKQSIYGFRGADAGIMENLRRELLAGGGRVYTLQDNYRSKPALTGLVNTVCAPLMGGESGYEPLRAKRGDAEPNCAEMLIAPGDKLDREAEARILAARIASLLAAGTPVRDPGTGAVRAIRPGDVAVLLRAATNLAVYERALRLADLPYRVLAGGGFYRRREIRDLLLFLRAIEDPNDGTSLAAALRSPLFGVSDAGLWRVAGGSGLSAGFLSFEPDAPGLGEDGPRLARAREILLDLRSKRHLLGLDDLLREAIEATGFRALQAAYPDYRQRLANLDKLLAQAVDYANLGRGEIGEFLSYLEGLEDLAIRESEAALAAGSEAIAVMTVHAAKGLEFPAVFLPDLGRELRRDQPPVLVGEDGRTGFKFGSREDGEVTPVWLALWEQGAAREEAEAKRLLYVALTRARDYLFLIGSGERSGPSWLKWLLETLPGAADGNTVAYPHGELLVAREPPAPPVAAPRNTLAAQYPGILRGEAIGPPVEAAAAGEPAPMRMETKFPVLTVSALQTYLACPRRYHLLYALGLPEFGAAPDGETPGGGGAALGTYVHALAEAIVSRRGTASGAEEVGADADLRRLLDNFRASPSFRALAEAAAVRTEYEFLLDLGCGRVSGAMDLVWLDGAGRRFLADLKTNRVDEPPAYLLAGHVLQVQIYALALVRIDGRPVQEARLEYLWPGVSRPVPVDEASLALVRERAERALTHIAQHGGYNDYPARASEACRWCGYRRIACELED